VAPIRMARAWANTGSPMPAAAATPVMRVRTWRLVGFGDKEKVRASDVLMVKRPGHAADPACR